MKAPGSIVCEARTRPLHPSVRPRPAPIRVAPARADWMSRSLKSEEAEDDARDLTANSAHLARA